MANSAHDVLFLPELRRQIFFQLSSDTSAKQRRSDLRSCALACSDWQNDALDLLWESLDSIEPIAMVLGTIKRRNPRNYKDKMLVFENPPDSAAWGRVRIYSERVRELVLGFGNYLPLEYDVLKVIVDDEYPGCEEILVEFFHQQVDSLILDIQWDDAYSLVSLFTQSILKEAGRCFHHLTSLSPKLWDEVETPQVYVEAIAASFSLFPGLVKLEVLCCPEDVWDFSVILREAAQYCPNLESIPCSSVRTSRSSSKSVSVQSLRRLEASDSDAQALINLLEGHPMPELTIFKMDSREFDWVFGSAMECQRLSEAVWICRSILSIDLTDLIRFSITDDDLTFLGCCLPSLKVFKALPYESPGSLPSLKGLHNLAEHAVQLRILKIQIIPTYPIAGSGSSDLVLDTLNSFKHLDHLDLGYSSLDPAWSRVVSLIMGRILPLDCQFDVKERYVEEHSDATWKKVKEELEIIRAYCRGSVVLPSSQFDVEEQYEEGCGNTAWKMTKEELEILRACRRGSIVLPSSQA
ncbi:hypothetical protein D9758_010524 [Tetrapyrgos nigripes]|uniref:F-box domain-containing protein n=1 Tax=Tetrapyrgos nigripes TaxID=182062 RepID=A0A8H5CZI5_9AGAR|nr:hypothetical protein D9758_010524 [Tetrapyrgos nigripes]